MPQPVPYRGRFAPSPSGPLHLGSLVAAMASYLHARQHQGSWLLRIEDVDETRTVTGAADQILSTLDALGFEWDEQVIHQSRRKTRYAEILHQLIDSDLAYPCACSRADIANSGALGSEGWIYAGTCRNGLAAGKTARTVRLRTVDQPICFTDLVAGCQQQCIESEVGDFVLRRADGFTAYQLAVVVDDADQAISHVVRGADLLNSTPRQIYLQQLLKLMTPQYAHVPLVLDQQGRKLSKQDSAHPVSTRNPLAGLRSAYRFLYGSDTEEDLASSGEFWRWAFSQSPEIKVSA